MEKEEILDKVEILIKMYKEGKLGNNARRC